MSDYHVKVPAFSSKQNETSTSTPSAAHRFSPLCKSPPVYAKLLYLCLGSWLGVLCRYGLTLACASLLSPTGSYPLATSLANVLGCAVIGFATAASKSEHTLKLLQHGKYPNARIFTVVGFCGSLTTFSAYLQDTYQLIYTARQAWSRGLWLAAINIAVNNVACFLAVLVAYRVGTKLSPGQPEDEAVELQATEGGDPADETQSEERDADLLNVDAD